MTHRSRLRSTWYKFSDQRRWICGVPGSFGRHLVLTCFHWSKMMHLCVARLSNVTWVVMKVYEWFSVSVSIWGSICAWKCPRCLLEGDVLVRSFHFFTLLTNSVSVMSVVILGLVIGVNQRLKPCSVSRRFTVLISWGGTWFGILKIFLMFCQSGVGSLLKMLGLLGQDMVLKIFWDKCRFQPVLVGYWTLVSVCWLLSFVAYQMCL